jgi:hypothetical protein
MSDINMAEAFERVQSALVQFKTVRRLLGTVDMITPSLLSTQLVEQINVMVCVLKASIISLYIYN